jgi:hypothetical protein
MKTKTILWVALTVFLVSTAFAFVGVVRAQERSFTLPWSVIGSGGMGGAADGYTIHSTLGQPVAGSADGGTYHLTSGFWTDVQQVILQLFNYLPLIVR